MRGLHVKTDGGSEYVEVKDLADMQRIVGGWLEMVPLRGAPFTMYCNEEGKVKDLKVNSQATALADSYRTWFDPIVGEVLLMGPPTSSGDDTDVPEDTQELVITTVQATVINILGIG